MLGAVEAVRAFPQAAVVLIAPLLVFVTMFLFIFLPPTINPDQEGDEAPVISYVAFNLCLLIFSNMKSPFLTLVTKS